MNRPVKIAFLLSAFLLPFCNKGEATLFYYFALSLPFLLAAVFLVFSKGEVIAGKKNPELLPAALFCLLPGIFALFMKRGSISSAEFALFGCFLLCALTFFYAKGEDALRPLFAMLAVAALLTAVYGLYQYFFLFASWSSASLTEVPSITDPVLRHEIIKNIAERRVFSYFLNSNVYAGYLACMVPVTLSLFLSASKQRFKVLGAISLLLCLFALVMTKSFGGALAAAAGVMVYMFLQNRNARRALLLTAGMCVMLSVFAYVLKPELIDLNNPNNPLFGRLQYWKDALRLILAAPFLGSGQGAFRLHSVSGVMYPHNMYLQYALEYGVPGVLAMVFFVVMFFRKVLSLRVAGNDAGKLALGAAAGASAFLVHALMDIDSNYFQNISVFFVLSGAVFSLPSVKKEKNIRNSPAAGLIFASAFTLSLLLAREHSLNLALTLLLLAGGAGFLFVRDREFPAGAAVYASLWLIVICVISAVASPSQGTSLVELCRLFCAVFAYLAGRSAAKEPGAGEFVHKAAMLAGIILSAAYILSLSLSGDANACLNFPNKNLLGGLLAAIAAFCLPRVYSRGGSALLNGITLVLCVSAAIFTGSRGVLLSLGFMLVFFFIQSIFLVAKGAVKEKARFILSVSVSCAIICCIIASLLFPGSPLTKAFNKPSADPLALARADIYKSAAKMCSDRPVTGVGLGCFGGVFQRYKFPVHAAVARYGRNADFAHSEYLQAFAELGVPGGLVFLSVIGLVLYASWRSFRRSGSSDAFLRAGIFLALLSIFIHALVDFNLHFLPVLFFAAFLSGLSGGFDRRSLKLKGTVPSLLALALILPSAAMLYQSLSVLASSDAALAGDEEKEKILSAARVLDPSGGQCADSAGQFYFGRYLKEKRRADLKSAEEAFLEAATLDKLETFYPRHLARVYALEGRLNEAETELIESETRAPFDPFVKSELAEVRMEKRDTTGAIKALEAAVKLEPNYVLGNYNLGRLYALSGRAKAGELLKARALKLNGYLLPVANTDYEKKLVER